MANREKCKECGKVTLRISWSGLRTHEECKQKGYLTRTGKKAKLDNVRLFFPANVTDRTVRDWLGNDPYSNPGVMPDMVEHIVNREYDAMKERGEVMLWKSKADKGNIIKECQEAVEKIEPALNKLVLPFDYDVDFKFQAPLTLPHPDGGMETVLLIGFMDIIVRRTMPDGSHRWMVWDVKHTRDDYYWKKTQGQLGFYDLSNWVMTGEQTDAVGLLQPLCKERVKPVKLDDNTRSVLMQRVTGMARDIWMDDRTPRVDNKLCNYCPVKHACTKFKPVLVNGQRRISL